MPQKLVIKNPYKVFKTFESYDDNKLNPYFKGSDIVWCANQINNEYEKPYESFSGKLPFFEEMVFAMIMRTGKREMEVILLLLFLDAHKYIKHLTIGEELNFDKDENYDILLGLDPDTWQYSDRNIETFKQMYSSKENLGTISEKLRKEKMDIAILAIDLHYSGETDCQRIIDEILWGTVRSYRKEAKELASKSQIHFDMYENCEKTKI